MFFELDYAFAPLSFFVREVMLKILFLAQTFR